MRLEIPLFQRPYVWTEDRQWAPLWEDIQRKFEEYLEGREEIPVHFLGAIVLDQKQTPATHVERRLVIDGQQRLTTLQIFLNAYRDFCRAVGATALADECATYTLNKGMMPDPEVDKFKVWPTQLDRPAFINVVSSGSPDELKLRYPPIRQKWARKDDPRPSLVDCYLYFYDQIQTFFNGTADELPLLDKYPVDQRLEQSFQALRNALMVVAIDLEQGDDAQVIFETLNARGQALLPADLLRNYIFLRATRHGEASEELYKKYWAGFDEPYWQETVSQGRLNRPRSDLFMQHFLTSQQTVDVPIGHLYVEYRHWIERKSPFKSVEAELQVLSSNRENFRSLLDADYDRPYSSMARFLRAYDIGTAYPLLMLLLESKADDQQVHEICRYLESYLVRRAVCGLTNKNYNRVFLQLARTFKKEDPTPELVASLLSGLRGESTEWPSDETFRMHWSEREIYKTLSAPRIVFLLSRMNDALTTSKTETIKVEDPLSIEHLMPQGWIGNWPLPNGSKGVVELGILGVGVEDESTVQTRLRNHLVQTIGNLTLVRQELNSALSNSAWAEKKKHISDWSLLPINLLLQGLEVWNEDMIMARSQALFAKALEIWPRA